MRVVRSGARSRYDVACVVGDPKWETVLEQLPTMGISSVFAIGLLVEKSWSSCLALPLVVPNY